MKRSQRGKWQPRYFKTQGHYILYKRSRDGDWLGGIDLESEGASIRKYTSHVREGLASSEHDCLCIKGMDTSDKERTMRTIDVHYSYSEVKGKVEGGVDLAISPSIARWYGELQKRNPILAVVDEEEFLESDKAPEKGGSEEHQPLDDNDDNSDAKDDDASATPAGRSLMKTD